MPGKNFHNMSAQPVDVQISHLAHLVSTVTNQLSACLSFSRLIEHCLKHASKSRTMLARCETYHSALHLTQKSLTSFIPYVEIQLGMTTSESPFYRTESGVVNVQAAYESLREAATECAKLPDMLKKLYDQQEWLDENNQAQQWRGWPECFERSQLQYTCETMVNLRDSGGETDVGWGTAWPQLSGDGDSCDY